MKKMIALLLALLLFVSLVTVCFADGGLADGDSPVGEPHEDPENPTDESMTSPDTGVSYLLASAALLLGFAGLIASGKKLFYTNV